MTAADLYASEPVLGETFVSGKTQQTARDLLQAAADLGYEPLVVRTVRHGFIVPNEVHEQARIIRAEREGADF